MQLFLVGSSNDNAYSYELPTEWSIVGKSYSSSFDISSQVTSPNDLTMSDDGEVMYILTSSSGIFQYNLGSAWDITSAVYDDVCTSAVDQSTTSKGLIFNDDGTKIFVTEDDNNYVRQTTVPTAWDVTSITTSSGSVTYDVSSATSAACTYPTAIAFNGTGTIMYVSDYNDRKIYQFALSTGWDLSTASYTKVSSALGTDDIYGFRFSDDGTKLFTVEYNNLREYDLTTAWDVAAITEPESHLETVSEDSYIFGLYMKPADPYYKQSLFRQPYQYNPYPLLGGV